VVQTTFTVQKSFSANKKIKGYFYDIYFSLAKCPIKEFFWGVVGQCIW
jgi:hypothetical protein